jgi:hypothetical protein
LIFMSRATSDRLTAASHCIVVDDGVSPGEPRRRCRASRTAVSDMSTATVSNVSRATDSASAVRPPSTTIARGPVGGGGWPGPVERAGGWLCRTPRRLDSSGGGRSVDVNEPAGRLTGGQVIASRMTPQHRRIPPPPRSRTLGRPSHHGAHLTVRGAPAVGRPAPATRSRTAARRRSPAAEVTGRATDPAAPRDRTRHRCLGPRAHRQARLGQRPVQPRRRSTTARHHRYAARG